MRLRKTRALANRSYGRNVSDSSMLATLDLTNALKNLQTDISLSRFHLFPP